MPIKVFLAEKSLLGIGIIAAILGIKRVIVLSLLFTIDISWPIKVSDLGSGVITHRIGNCKRVMCHQSNIITKIGIAGMGKIIAIGAGQDIVFINQFATAGVSTDTCCCIIGEIISG